MKSFRIIVISSVRPEPTSAGHIILHRHLADQPGIEWESFGAEPSRLTASSAVRRAMGRLAKTRLHRFAQDFWAWHDGRWLDPLLPKAVPAGEQAVVLTVAHGDACGAALRFAKKNHLPLVTFFHDWWPAIPSVHPPCRPMLERKFRKLHQGSTLSLCISEGMLKALGPHPSAQVLLPVPQKRTTAPRSTRNREQSFRLLYFGNLLEYGPMLGKAIETLHTSSTLRLEARGHNPRWPAELKERAAASGTWLDFAPRTELSEWQESADAFLVPMMFDPLLRRRMETSFPSKISEMAQFGKPLVIWGPDYCSAVQWARQGNRALCITDSNPAALRHALEALAASADEQQRLSAAARQAALTDFNPERIHAQFMEAMRRVVGNANQRCPK